MYGIRIINANVLKSRLPFFATKIILFFFNGLVACDEKWILYDNRKRSAQWLNTDKTPQHFSKRKLQQKKFMVILGGLQLV